MGRKIALDKLTFISGGQTGIDRAVLDFCLEHHLRCGGWCPEGRMAEDGPIHQKYPVRELPGASYDERTLANVRDGEATIILYHGTMSGGTLKSFECAIKLDRPLVLLNFDEVSPRKAATMFTEFMNRVEPSVINLSGPRQSEWQQAYEICISFLNHILHYH